MTESVKQWMMQCADILRAIRIKHPYSEIVKSSKPGDDFFDDSCEFVGLHHELSELESCMRNIVRYYEMLES